MPHVQNSGYDWCPTTTRLAIYHRDKFACVACGFRIAAHEALGGGLTLDHVDPTGGNAPQNLVTMCCSCNASFGDGPKPPKVRRRIAARTAKPIVREVGRILCELLRPDRLEQLRASAAKRRAGLREQPAEVPF